MQYGINNKHTDRVESIRVSNARESLGYYYPFISPFDTLKKRAEYFKLLGSLPQLRDNTQVRL